MTDYFYGRASTEDQKLTLSAQTSRALGLGIKRENIFIDAARTGGLKDDDTIRWEYKEGFFITRINFNPRPRFKSLLDKVTRNDSITYIKHDRISRHNACQDLFHSFCHSRGVKLTCLEESNDRLTRRILAIISEEELFKDADRTQRIQEYIYQQDGWSYKSPMGYEKNVRVKDGAQKGSLKFPDLPESSLVIIPSEAEKVEQMFAHVAAGRNIKEVAAVLGVDRSAVYNVIRNNVYRGMIHFKGDTDWKPSALVPRLVSDEVWARANSNIKGKSFKAGERGGAQ